MDAQLSSCSYTPSFFFFSCGRGVTALELVAVMQRHLALQHCAACQSQQRERLQGQGAAAGLSERRACLVKPNLTIAECGRPKLDS